MTKTNLQVVRSKEGWASPDLLAQDMLRINEEIFNFQPRYVAGTNQVLSLGRGTLRQWIPKISNFFKPPVKVVTIYEVRKYFDFLLFA